MNILRLFAGAVIGGAAGYAMYRFVGCPTGACPITSNPWTSTLVGIIIGALAGARV